MKTYNISVIIKFSNNNIFVVENEDIIKFSRGNRTSSDSSALVIGIISRYGTLVIKDKNDYILSLSENNLIKNNAQIEIYRGKACIGRYSSVKNWTYDYSKSEVTIELKSRILEWSDIYIKNGVPYIENVDGVYALNYLMGISQKQYSESENIFNTVPSYVIEYLSNIHFTKLYIEPDNLDKLWKKFCDFALLKVFENDNGKIQIERF